jgi:hypothetical protein
MNSCSRTGRQRPSDAACSRLARVVPSDTRCRKYTPDAIPDWRKWLSLVLQRTVCCPGSVGPRSSTSTTRPDVSTTRTSIEERPDTENWISGLLRTVEINARILLIASRHGVLCIVRGAIVEALNVLQCIWMVSDEYNPRVDTDEYNLRVDTIVTKDIVGRRNRVRGHDGTCRMPNPQLTVWPARGQSDYWIGVRKKHGAVAPTAAKALSVCILKIIRNSRLPHMCSKTLLASASHVLADPMRGCLTCVRKPSLRLPHMCSQAFLASASHVFANLPCVCLTCVRKPSADRSTLIVQDC